MKPDPTDRLTEGVSCDNQNADRERRRLDEFGERQRWSKRLSWAKCSEPFKTELDTLADHWIECHLSNEDLSLQLWELWAKFRFTESPSKTSILIPLPDVQSQIEILVQALLGAALYPSTSSADRRGFLDRSRNAFGVSPDHSP